MRKDSVLVVGAGPTGLVTAIQLRHYGLEPRVVDRYRAPLKGSKAAAMHARALEFLDDLGCVEKIVDDGQWVEILDLRTYYRDRVRLDFKPLHDTKFNYICDYPQSDTEYVLMDRFAELDGHMNRGVKLTDLQQDGDGVNVTLEHEDGEVESARYDWVIGCDGSKSTVRSLIGQEFKGGAYAEPWALADVKLDWPLPRNEMTFCSDPTGICGVFPLPGEKSYRIAYTLTLDAAGKPAKPSEQNLIEALRRTGVTAESIEIGEFWPFDLAHRQTDRYRVDRVFLAGDAAHVHTPFGGQGLNMGIGDAFNLGWKLGLTATGGAAPGLLDTYEPERHKIGGEVVKTTHLGVSLMLIKAGLKARARNALLGTVGAIAPVRKKMTRRLSQLDHSYADGPPVALHLRAGDRFANIAFYDGNSDQDRRAYDLLRTTKHTVLFTNPRSDPPATRELCQAASALKARYHDRLTCALITPHFQSLPEGDEFDDLVLDREHKFKALYGRGCRAHVVRPDMHLSGINIEPEPSAISAVLDMTLRPANADSIA